MAEHAVGSATASFDLPTAPARFLARALADALDEGWRSAEDFLRHFPPHDLMQALAGQEVLRAAILIGAAGVHAKLARKKPAHSAAEDLELALEEGVTDAGQILELFPVEDRVRYLDARKLWAFLCEDRFWVQGRNDPGYRAAATRISFMLRSAADENLVRLEEVVTGIGFSTIAESLPPARLQELVRQALELGHAGQPFDEAALLETLDLSELLEHVPLEQVFRSVIVEQIALPAGFADSLPEKSRSVVPPLSDAEDDAKFENAFASLQAVSGAEPREKPRNGATPAPLPDDDEPRQRMAGRLERMNRLPPSHASLSLAILSSIEGMYTELLTLTDDAAREQCIRESFADQEDLRTAMLALIELLDPSIDTQSPLIAGADLDSLIAVVLFEERARDEKRASIRSNAPPASGARTIPRAAAASAPQQAAAKQ